MIKENWGEDNCLMGLYVEAYSLVFIITVVVGLRLYGRQINSQRVTFPQWRICCCCLLQRRVL